jgi:hypothetical protein
MLRVVLAAAVLAAASSAAPSTPSRAPGPVAVSQSLTCATLCDGAPRSAVRYHAPGVSCTSTVQGQVDFPRAGPLQLPVLQLGVNLALKHRPGKAGSDAAAVVTLQFVGGGLKTEVAVGQPRCIEVAHTKVLQAGGGAGAGTAVAVVFWCVLLPGPMLWNSTYVATGSLQAYLSLVDLVADPAVVAPALAAAVSNVTVAAVSVGLHPDCRVLPELPVVVCLFALAATLPLLALFRWAVPGPGTRQPWASLRDPNALGEGLNVVGCVGYLFARFGQAEMYASQAVADVLWIVLAGVESLSACLYFRSWHGAAPGPSFLEATAGYAAIAASAVYVVTSLLYLYSDVDAVVTTTTYLELLGCFLYAGSAMLDFRSAWRERGSLLALPTAAGALDVVVALLYAVGGVSG